MMTIQLCKFSHCRLWPAWGSNAAGWQFHWLWLYVEWLESPNVALSGACTAPTEREDEA